MRQTLETVNEVVEALGGIVKIAELTSVQVTAVHNWRAKEKISSRQYVIIDEALRRVGKRASPSIFGMQLPAQEPAE